MSFAEVLGQQKAKRFLRRVLERGKIPHAYLFTGIPGTGKTTTAKALAMALNCESSNGWDGCGKCTSCRHVREGSAPDFLLIEPEGQNIRIGQIRELNRRVGFAPVTAKYRVCVMRRAETMTEEAANSFLKLLEEPPPGNLLILCAVEPLDLLPTIVSRCQKVPFEPLGEELIRRYLEHEADVDSERASVLAKLCEGSLGRAIAMWEGGLLERRLDWLSDLMKLPDLPGEKAFQAAQAWVGTEGGREGRYGSENDHSGLLGILGVWESWYRDLLLVKLEGPMDSVVNSDFLRELKKMAKRIKVEALMESVLLLDRAQRQLRKNRNRALVMESCVLGLRRLSGVEAREGP